MYAATLKTLKEQIYALEKSLLAIDTLNDINMQNLKNGNRVIDLDHTANLLDHLIQPAMYQVEAVRTMIDDMQKLPMLVTA
jgi:hypothetical protein